MLFGKTVLRIISTFAVFGSVSYGQEIGSQIYVQGEKSCYIHSHHGEECLNTAEERAIDQAQENAKSRCSPLRQIRVSDFEFKTTGSGLLRHTIAGAHFQCVEEEEGSEFALTKAGSLIVSVRNRFPCRGRCR
jgi:hypothetical protein